MADIQRGITFTTGIPDAASAHQLVDSATILPAFITAKPFAFPSSNDNFIYNKGGALMKCSLAQLVATFPINGPANVASLRMLGTAAGTAAAGNDARFPSRITGIRKANGVGADTVAKSHDLVLPVVNISTLSAIDWSVTDKFYGDITGNKTYTLTGGVSGQVVTIQVRLNGHTLAFTGATMATLGTGTTWAYVVLAANPVGVIGYRVNI